MSTRRMMMAMLSCAMAVGGLAKSGAAVTVSIPAEADSYVYSDSRWAEKADTNYGSQEDLAVNNYTWDVVNVCRKVYLRFDLSSLPSRSKIAVRDAHIVLSEKDTTPHTCRLYVYSLNDSDPGQLWDESTITFNNAPGNAPNGDFLNNTTYGATATVDMTGVLGTLYPIPVYAGVSAITEDTDNKLTFILYREGSDNGAYFISKEGAVTSGFAAPSLEIVYDLAPLGQIHGVVDVQNFVGNKEMVGVEVKLQPVTDGEAETRKVFLNSDGSFTLQDIVPGTYNVSVKGYASLRTTLTNVAVAAGNEAVELGTILLKSGDCDGDNGITSTDLSALLMNMDVDGE